MSAQTWTKEEIMEFDRLIVDRLIDKKKSRNQVERIVGRMELNDFVKQHGKEKCDAMWAHMKANGGKP